MEFFEAFSDFLGHHLVCSRVIHPIERFTGNGWSTAYVLGFGFTAEGIRVLTKAKMAEETDCEIGRVLDPQAVYTTETIVRKKEDLETCLKHALGN